MYNRCSAFPPLSCNSLHWACNDQFGAAFSLSVPSLSVYLSHSPSLFRRVYLTVKGLGCSGYVASSENNSFIVPTTITDVYFIMITFALMFVWSERKLHSFSPCLQLPFSHRSLTDTSAIVMAHSFPSVLSERTTLILVTVLLVLVSEVHSQGYILSFPFHSSHSFTRYTPTLIFLMMRIIFVMTGLKYCQC